MSSTSTTATMPDSSPGSSHWANGKEESFKCLN
jgi:hypothetical protein